MLRLLHPIVSLVGKPDASQACVGQEVLVAL